MRYANGKVWSSTVILKWSYCLLKLNFFFIWNLLFHALVNYLKMPQNAPFWMQVKKNTWAASPPYNPPPLFIMQPLQISIQPVQYNLIEYPELMIFNLIHSFLIQNMCVTFIFEIQQDLHTYMYICASW